MKATVLGGGFAGCTVAHLLHQEGWETTLIEREPHLGGGCRTFFHCGHPFQYGPRLYYGYSKLIFEWLDMVVPIRLFPFELKTLADEPVDSDRQFWTYPPHMDDVSLYPRASQIQEELAARNNYKEPRDFDEYYRQRVGPTIYQMFTEFYSQRMWRIESNKQLDTFSWSAKDEPLAKGGREAYKGSYIGFPTKLTGYNDYFDKMIDGINIITGHAKVVNLESGPVQVLVNGRTLDPDVVVSTMPIDELVGLPDSLPYVGRDFHLLMLPCEEIFPGNVKFCHYAGRDDEWTRVTEFKKLTGYKSPNTLLLLENPSSNGKLYISQTKAVQAKVKEYLGMLPKNVYSIGRLGTGRYSTIEQAIAMAFACAATITGKPNRMEGQDFAIGDKSMLPANRKRSA